MRTGQPTKNLNATTIVLLWYSIENYLILYHFSFNRQRVQAVKKQLIDKNKKESIIQLIYPFKRKLY
jgi:hypothetical protein